MTYYLQNLYRATRFMIKFSLLWYEILSLERHWGIKYKQSIQSSVVEIYLLKAPHNGMKFLFYLRLKIHPLIHTFKTGNIIP